MPFSNTYQKFCKRRRLKSFFYASFFVSVIFVFYQASFFLKLNEFQFSTLRYGKAASTELPFRDLDLEQIKSLLLETKKNTLQPVTASKESKAEKFQCKNSKEQIPLEWVNDDYCDCEDGTDETETSACGISSFICKSRSRKEIPSSRVNDGICDCCDGSDEWKNITSVIKLEMIWQEKLSVFLSPCSNRCPP